ncbi:MAG: protein translocase subunit SecF [Chlorobi bacterium]|nr:protein translocase subunit SecF [Chlorobiota bacterium]
MRIFHKTGFDFIKHRKIAYAISAVLLLSGLVSLAVRGLNYGIDFRGGSEVVIRFEKNIDVSSVRSVLKEAGVSGTLKQYGLDRSFLLSTVFNGQTNELKSLISNAFRDRIADNPHEIVRIDSVGPSIASDLKWSAVKAMLAALVAILIYVGFRYEIKFAAAGVLAIFHDVLTVLGLFSMLGGIFAFMPLEMDQSIIAAFLTVAGYSITDTVVVYDRIRERIRGSKPSEYAAIFNESMNQTLSRTIVTGGTTLISVLILFIFAGPAIRGFAFAVFTGILIGTYSSIFIAAPLVYDWLRATKSVVRLRGGSAS